MPAYDFGVLECGECQRAFGPDRSAAIQRHQRRVEEYAALANCGSTQRTKEIALNALHDLLLGAARPGNEDKRAAIAEVARVAVRLAIKNQRIVRVLDDALAGVPA